MKTSHSAFLITQVRVFVSTRVKPLLLGDCHTQILVDEVAEVMSIDRRRVEAALAAINTAHNQVSSEISLAQAAADQKIVQSKRAVEIETLNAQAEVEPLLTRWPAQLRQLKAARVGGAQGLPAQRAARPLRARPSRVFLEVAR